MTGFTGPYATQLESLQNFLMQQRQAPPPKPATASTTPDPTDSTADKTATAIGESGTPAPLATSPDISVADALGGNPTIQEAQRCVATLRQNSLVAIQALRQPNLSPEEREKYEKEQSEFTKDLQMFMAMLNSATTTTAVQLAQRAVADLPQKQIKAPGSGGKGIGTKGKNKQAAGDTADPKSPPIKSEAADRQVTSPTPGSKAKPKLKTKGTSNAEDGKPGVLDPPSLSRTTSAAAASAGRSLKHQTLTPLNANETLLTLSGPLTSTSSTTAGASGNDNNCGGRLLGKRRIQELVAQVDASERLEPEVEDMLCEIADEFIESVTSFACQLAKHRKSRVLEAKDVQLHLERNWNIRIPGFASEQIRSLRKPVVHPRHENRMQFINMMRNMKRFESEGATSNNNPPPS
ncbi:Transcription initiation factor TFIID subunit 12 [Tieghemiomyces parasiticus]|uniref:TBP-associated factor 12 n=1 Tax=Tieghemiomyces parasiticus TaxID=78921 RepID=A0A9W7ZHE2_9FUNG|nr:Transcription initiation factor TFIID subunit 12 [Tieghemiomyces parasiticus]